MKMKDKRKRILISGIVLLAAFVLWTVLIRYIDVQAAGPNGTKIGFSGLNVRFHQMTGVHMTVYTVTDWLGLVPIAVCLCFGVFGLVQLIKRKSLFKVDFDILLLGAYYVLIILGYLFFEAVPVNYRPILIDGRLEASYPSSTTLLVLGVMPTLKFQVDRRTANTAIKILTTVFVTVFSSFMVTGRLISGVHWVTDIVGSVLLSFGLYELYRFSVVCFDKKRSGSKTEAYNGV